MLVIGGFRVLSEESYSVGACVSGNEEGVLLSGGQAGRMETGRKERQARTGPSRSCHPLSQRERILEAAYLGREVVTDPLPDDFLPLQVPVLVSAQSPRQSLLESPGLALEAKQVMGHLSPQDLERGRSRQWVSSYSSLGSREGEMGPSLLGWELVLNHKSSGSALVKSQIFSAMSIICIF